MALIGSSQKSRKLGYVAVALVLLGGGLTVGPAAYLQSVLDGAFIRLQENPLTTSPPFTDKEQSLLDMTAAVFNECCFKVWDAQCGTEYQTNDVECAAPLYDQGTGIDLGGDLRDSQIPVLPCSDSSACASSQYAPIIGTINIDSIEDLLCTCYSSETVYQKYVTAIRDLGSCAAFEKVVIENADEVEIPGFGFTFGALPGAIALGGGRSELADAEIDRFAMVGKMYPAESTFGEPAEEIGFSCGLGYAKGMTFQMYLGVERATEISIYGAYACGGIQILAALLTMVYWSMGGGREDDGWGVDHYDTQPAQY